MIKMISDCPEITKIILGIIYGDERTTIQYHESKREVVEILTIGD